MKTIFSGIQPSGEVQLGNYIGAISSWIELQNIENTRNIYSIVDLHSITVYQDPQKLQDNVLSLVALLIASGIETNKSVLFVQSSNHCHAELSWILNCVVRLGWLNRMTQFKDKAGNNKEQSSAGLYIYPVLQAADILLYDTNIVPVGEDQKQHIELARDIALKFNRDYSEVFTIPEDQISKTNARIMSLKDPSKKMSKSAPSDSSKILFSDTNDSIVKKIMKATTDALPMPVSEVELEERLAVKNLMSIYSFCSKKSVNNIINDYQNKGFSDFKKDLADLVVSLVSPIRDKQLDLLKNKGYLLSEIKKGQQKSLEISEPILEKVKKAIGFL